MRQFHSKLDHLGLNYFVNPEGKGIVDLEYAQGYHSQNDEQSKKQNKKGRSFLLEEGDLGDLEDQLRQLYIKRHTVKGIIARGLLEVERKHFKSNRRTGLFDEFENIFKKSFYKDKTDAIEYAKEKRKIKSQGEKQLPLINN